MKMNPIELKAKMSVLEQLKKEMSDELENKYLKGMKKVTVASDSKEGLEKGLEMAKEKIKEIPEMDDEKISIKKIEQEMKPFINAKDEKQMDKMKYSEDDSDEEEMSLSEDEIENLSREELIEMLKKMLKSEKDGE